MVTWNYITMENPKIGLLVRATPKMVAYRPYLLNVVGEIVKPTDHNVWYIWWPQLDKLDEWHQDNFELFNKESNEAT